jgi:hypothetical protein
MRLKQSNVMCALLETINSQPISADADLLDTIIDAGIGIAVWLRPEKESNQRQLSDKTKRRHIHGLVHDFPLNGLAERVLKYRQEFSGSGSPCCLTLLWDDPENPFPDSIFRFIQPLARRSL